MTKRATFFLPAVIAFMFLSGCNALSLPAGRYQGTLIEKQNGGVFQTAVSSDLSYPDASSARITVEDTDQKLLTTIGLNNLQNNGLDLSVPGIITSIHLNSDTDGGYRDSTQNPTADLTITATGFLLQVFAQDHTPVMTLSGDQFATEAPLPYESPRPYVLSDAIQAAMHQNFNSQIAFEQEMQAKASAKAAYLNLLPHLNLSDILGNLTPTALSLLDSIGDIAPFLLPSRWMQAQQADLEAQAQDDAMILMQLNSGAQVEGLAYALQRDEGIVAFYGYLTSRAQQAHDLSAAIERAGTFPVGSTDHLTAVIQSMELDLQGLNELVRLDKEAIAQALGLFNPDGVEEITFGPETPSLDQATALDSENTSNGALQRSYELQQIDYLIDVAHSQETSLFFNWLDPSGDPTEDLGLNLVAQVEVSNEHVSTLQLQREQLQQIVAQNVFGAINDYNEAIASNTELKSSMALDEKRLNTDIAQLTPNSQLNTLDIEGILQDYLAMGIRQQDVIASFRIARSKIDRALLQSAYLSAGQ